MAALEAERLLAEEEVPDASGEPHVPDPGCERDCLHANL